MSPPLAYTPLDQQRKEIRLFHAQRAGNNVLFSITHASIDEASKLNYVALSYTWGSNERIHPIQVNKRQILVTANLKAFLKQLSLDIRGENYVWIDSICINQEDDAEKSWQVQMMWSIYERAAVVLVWLGTASEDSDKAMDYFDKVAKDIEIGAAKNLKAFRDFHGFPAHGIPNPFNLTPNDELHRRLYERIKDIVHKACEKDDVPLEALSCIFRQQWWERVWVLQESLANAVVVVTCGTKETEMSNIRMVFRALESCNHRLMPKHLKGEYLTPQQQRVLRWTWKNLKEWATPIMRGGSYGWAFDGVLETIYFPENGLSSRRMKSSNPKDYVYALLGLARDRESVTIVPDYSLSCQEIYTQTGRSLIQRGNLDILWFTPTRNRMDGLPSWVPDWSTDLLTPILTQLGTLLGFQVNLLGGFQVRLKYYGTLYITNDI